MKLVLGVAQLQLLLLGERRPGTCSLPGAEPLANVVARAGSVDHLLTDAERVRRVPPDGLRLQVLRVVQRPGAVPALDAEGPRVIAVAPPVPDVLALDAAAAG